MENNIVVINNLNFKYENHKVYDHFNLSIKKGTFNTIIGPNGSGKSTLAKILLGIEKTNDFVKVCNFSVNKANLKKIRQKIGVVFEKPDNMFVAETVMDEIAFSLENMQLDRKIIRNKVLNISKLIGISDILEYEPHSISKEQKQLVSIASALVIEPEILILDEALNMLDPIIKRKVLMIIKKLNLTKNLTILNITEDIEDSVYGDEIIIIYDGKVKLQGKKEKVFQEELIFEQLDLKLPFVVELSYKLMFYNLIDRLYFDMEDLVNVLWK